MPEDADAALAIAVRSLHGSCFDSHLGEEMVRRGGIAVVSGIPPLVHLLERILVGGAIDQMSAILHPAGQIGMSLRVEGFHVGIGHQEHLHAFQGFGIGKVLDVGYLHGDTVLEERHG